MEGFKKLPKMQCFKEGGSVKFTSKTMKESGKADIAQDKKIVKKALAMHDKQEHPGEKTDLSKLRKGGRAKKSVGTVKKFACGGGVYGAKKTKKDIKSIDAAKDCKPKKLSNGGSLKETDAQDNPGLAKLPTNVRNKMGYMRKGGKAPAMKKGGKVKKYAGDTDGSYVDVKNPQALTDKIATEENTADRDLIMKPVRAVKKMINKGIDAVKSGLKGQGAVSDEERSNVNKKKGGKVRKFAEGGFTTEEEKWLGGADRTDPFILARMKSAMGNKKPSAPVAAPVKPETSADLDPYGAASKMPVAPRPAPMAAGPSADERLSMRNARPVQAPNVEQDSGVAYPQGNPGPNLFANRPQSMMQRFANVSPVEQASQFNRGAQARKNFGRRPTGMPATSLDTQLAALNKRRG